MTGSDLTFLWWVRSTDFIFHSTTNSSGCGKRETHWGFVCAHAWLVVHLEQLRRRRLLRPQRDSEGASGARLAFCSLPQCLGLDGSQAEDVVPVRVSSVRSCRTATGVLSGLVQWNCSRGAHSCFHQPLYQINDH